MAPATEGRDGDSGADTLWTGVTLVPLTQKPSNQTVFNLYTSFQGLPATHVVCQRHPYRGTLTHLRAVFIPRMPDRVDSHQVSPDGTRQRDNFETTHRLCLRTLVLNYSIRDQSAFDLFVIPFIAKLYLYKRLRWEIL